MGIRIWAGQQPFANAGPGPTRLLENESCEWPLWRILVVAERKAKAR
jgi:hypothetical protein